MDPQVAWDQLLEAIARKDLEAAEIHAENLAGWLTKGGFAPQPFSRLLTEDWDRQVCLYVCRRVLIAASTPKG